MAKLGVERNLRVMLQVKSVNVPRTLEWYCDLGRCAGGRASEELVDLRTRESIVDVMGQTTSCRDVGDSTRRGYEDHQSTVD